LRVLTFLHSFEPGGVERVALRLVRRWREVGVDAPLFIGRDEGALRDELASDLNFSLPPRPARWSGPLESWWMIFKLPAEIRRVKPDLLFCAGNTYTVVCVMMKLLLGPDCPPIVAKISNDLVLPGLSPWLRFLYGRWAWLQGRLIDGWVIMHPSMRAEVRATIGGVDLAVISDPALTTAQLTRLQLWRRRQDDAPGRRFVAMGRLVAQKNYPLMLDAFALGAEPEDRLTIFGDGPGRAELEALATDLGLAGRVHFAGHVPQSAEALLDHDILLLSSRYEGIPAALIEAMACGMPIVATDCGDGVRGLLEGCGRARLVKAHDVAAFSAAIGLACCGEAVTAAEHFDAAAFTIEAGAESYLDTFARIVNDAPRRRRGELLGNHDHAPDGLAPVSLRVQPDSGREAA
jgi:glycosyltransferase involved in cell wall biosynthesis